MKIDLYNGDCLEVMKDIPDSSIDLILTDPPYGTTVCKWDTVIDADLMWVQLKRIIKDNGAICLFGNEPFSSILRTSNIKMYKYDWVWNKVNKFTGFLNAKKMPMLDNELISVFYTKQCIYNRQMREGNYTTRNSKGGSKGTYNDGHLEDIGRLVNGLNPKRIIDFKSHSTKKSLHPTQKPVALMEYLIKTYTNEDETVLDFTMGSGTTGVACKNLNRNFIGIELDEDYFNTAKDRIESLNPLNGLFK